MLSAPSGPLSPAVPDTPRPGRSTRGGRHGSSRVAPLAGLVAAASALAAMLLAWQHPLSGAVALAGVALLGALAFARPLLALAALPALLPWLGGYPWSGWFVVEEFDLAVLAVAAGGWASRATGRGPRAPAGGGPRAAVVLAIALFAVSTAVAVHRGALDAGGWPAEAAAWSQALWHGYREPLNALRLGKSLFLALLLLPLLRGVVTQPGGPRGIALGLAAGLAGVGLQAMAERLAFPGLLNFSSDYRIVTGFWEMHVGGAALDGFLALAVPFAALLAAARGRVAVLGALALVLGLHTALVTFSRIDYVVIPAGLALLAALLWRQHKRAGGPAPVGGVGSVVAAAAAVVLAAALSLLVFPSSGYRGMLAVLGAMTLALPLATLPRPEGLRGIALALGSGLFAGAAVLAAPLLLPKGAYIGYTALWFATAAALLAARRGFVGGPALAGGAWLGLLVAAVGVARHWGEDPAVLPMAAAVGVLAAVLALVWARPAWPRPRAPRLQLATAGATLGAAALVGVFGGGDYMGGRVAGSAWDVQYRQQHWNWTLGLLQGPVEWSIGAGLGRFPERLFYANVSDEYRTGDLRLVDGGPGRGTQAVMTGGRHEIGWGQILRLSQRIEAPGPGRWTFSADVRTAARVGLHAEVCEKQLIYNGSCRFGAVEVEPLPGWQRVSIALDGSALDGGSWYAPQFPAFATGVLTRGGRLEIDNLSLVGPDGREHLANGGFDGGLARWFITSDHHHMPWHEKNQALFLLLAQGGLGLGLFVLLAVGAFGRTVAGAVSAHPLAPALAAALLGFLGVGLIDSLLDAPRVAFLFWCVLLLALTLPRPAPGGAGTAGL